MSKKKNTLKDLDEFLKQQAATLVTPSRLSETQSSENTEQHTEKPAPPPPQIDLSSKTVTAASIVADIRQLSAISGNRFTDEISDIILTVMEQQREFTAEEKMLINTVLYLKHGADWKDAIRAYWKKKSA